MSRHLTIVSVLVLTAICGASCARTTPLPGLTFGEGATIVKSSPEHGRARTQGELNTILNRELPDKQMARAMITELPAYDEDATRDRQWYWYQAQVKIQLIRAKGTEASTTEAEKALGALATAYMQPRVKAEGLLRVTVEQSQLDENSLKSLRARTPGLSQH